MAGQVVGVGEQHAARRAEQRRDHEQGRQSSVSSERGQAQAWRSESTVRYCATAPELTRTPAVGPPSARLPWSAPDPL